MAFNLFVVDTARWHGAVVFQRRPHTPRGARILADGRNQHALEAWERMTTGGVQVVGCDGQRFQRGHAIRLHWTSALNYTFRATRTRAA